MCQAKRSVYLVQNVIGKAVSKEAFYFGDKVQEIIIKKKTIISLSVKNKSI